MKFDLRLNAAVVEAGLTWSIWSSEPFYKEVDLSAAQAETWFEFSYDLSELTELERNGLSQMLSLGLYPNFEQPQGGMRIDVANIRIESGVAPVDTDEDGVNDFFDAFPNDPSEATDSDGDGVGDNADIYPNDPPREADFSLGFGGANFGEGGTYTVPSSAESWAGYANVNSGLYPLTFENGGRIAFMASVPDGGTADVRFRLERLPYDENDPSATEPSIDTVAVTVTGTEPALYEILIDPQGENTYSSFIMYIDTREVTVTVNDVMVDSGDGSLISGI